MEQIYDLIIIGAGPAGLTAAIYAARREMKTLVISKDVGGQIIWASEIENYPGFKNIKSYELIQKMQEQVVDLGVKIKNTETEKITKQPDDTFLVNTVAGQFVSRSIVLAMGLAPRQLNLPGEAELVGHGIAYCANCDGPFYKNKTVAVAGGGNAAVDAAEVLSKIAAQVYLIQNSDRLKAFESLIKKVQNETNVKIFLNSEIVEISGQNKLEKIKVKNNLSGEVVDLEVGGLFVEIGRAPKTDLVKDLVARNDQNYIIVDQNYATNVPGVFAAGDVTNGPYKQIIVACGQGSAAALSASQYLQLNGTQI